MPLQIIHGDITRLQVDAIVNAANSSLLGGGGVDGCIHRGAGPQLLEECRTLGGCETGQAKITKGYRLPCRYVIHTVGPIYKDGSHKEKELLESCYRESLRLAAENECETVAFPLISSGIYGYPKAEALQIATETIRKFLETDDITVFIVIFDKASFKISESLISSISEYIDNNFGFVWPADSHKAAKADSEMWISEGIYPLESSSVQETSLEEAIKHIDESFSQMLLRKIDEKGMKDSECYKKANIDRKLFSKIRSDIHYRPSKPTAIAFAIALELSLDETKELLMKAGFALSHSNEFDIIIEYFIERGNYDIFVINEALFAFDQCLLGA